MKSLIDTIRDIAYQKYPDITNSYVNTLYEHGIKVGEIALAVKLAEMCQSELDITIPKEEYRRLVSDSYELNRLIANGVDNWEGYSIGIEDDEDDV